MPYEILSKTASENKKSSVVYRQPYSAGTALNLKAVSAEVRKRGNRDLLASDCESEEVHVSRCWIGENRLGQACEGGAACSRV